MKKKSLALAVVLFVMAACDGHLEAISAPSVESKMWQSRCLERLSPALELETSRIAKLLPNTDSLDWQITIILMAGKTEVEIIPDTQPSLRGGGGKYHFDCDEGKLTLFEPYR